MSNPAIVSNRPFSEHNKADVNSVVSLKLAPNPATNLVNIYTSGLQQEKPLTLSVISASGVMIKMMQLNSSSKTIQLDVSNLVAGVYTIKMISGDKVLYKQFVKL